MTDLIHRLTTWVTLRLTPRSSPGRAEQPSPPAPVAAPLSPHRSPYGLDTPLDATANRSVRPYLTAHELWVHGLEIPGLEAA
ncbi:hypothetical protein ACFWWT_03370 [Streptomyces sp. NPDC058676]|uniref:hypothetical protein n=1 Tax=unclassified Streptomyces TaxID=2593676 RepID=UPI0036554997